MNPDLQTIVFQDNPWLRDFSALGSWLRSRLPACPIPRTMIDKGRSKWKDIHRAHLLVGPRQAGKSSAIWGHLAEVGEPVLYVDCEQALVREWCRSAPLFLVELQAQVGGPVALFFDEVEHLENAGLFVKGLVDRRVNVPVLVTGSSSYHLGSKIQESLAGRATLARLLPLAFSEVRRSISSTSEFETSSFTTSDRSTNGQMPARSSRVGSSPSCGRSCRPPPACTIGVAHPRPRLTLWWREVTRSSVLR